VFSDVALYQAGYLVADGLVGADTPLDNVAGDFQFWHVQDDHLFLHTGQGAVQPLPVDLDIVAAEGHQTAVVHQPLGFAPSGQIAQAVHAHQKIEFHLPIHPLAYEPHHVGGVVGAGPIRIHPAYADIVTVCGGKLGHADAVFDGGKAAVLFVGWVPCWHKIDPIQIQLEPSLFGQNQMADVDGIECAAKDADAQRPLFGCQCAQSIFPAVRAVAHLWCPSLCHWYLVEW